MIFRSSFRRILAVAVLSVSLSFPAAQAEQTAEEAWKNLVMQGLYTAGANDFPKAEQIFLKAVHEAERFGADDARVGTTLNSLGLVYRSENKHPQAEAAFRRALAILDQAYGPDSIDVANVNFNIASTLTDEGKQPAAMPFLEKSLMTFDRQLGGGSLKTASVLCMMGDAWRSMKSFQEAEKPLKRCAEIREAEGGLVANNDLADALNSLALVYQKEGKYALADPVFKLTEKIRERTLGIMSPKFAETLEAHSRMLREMGRDQEAEQDAALAAAVRRNEVRRNENAAIKTKPK